MTIPSSCKGMEGRGRGHGHRYLALSGRWEGSHDHTLLFVGSEGDEVMVTFIFHPLGWEEVRSWSPLSSILWEERK